ncbi:Coiled-coil domain-containing protein 173 like protein [Aduncisulcus paluster]|uniref:Coiled-coil domain-containing protein 173 like protein n=1 Tax=Aduncisulcus paluster TaxID=2918883 RepID=A0ABQ5KXM7_9EUKA|nr:Coiled-coil domain-containing protein 173 like protein [Aduncisulcus paluster]
MKSSKAITISSHDFARIQSLAADGDVNRHQTKDSIATLMRQRHLASERRTQKWDSTITKMKQKRLEQRKLEKQKKLDAQNQIVEEMKTIRRQEHDETVKKTRRMQKDADDRIRRMRVAIETAQIDQHRIDIGEEKKRSTIRFLETKRREKEEEDDLLSQFRQEELDEKKRKREIASKFLLTQKRQIASVRAQKIYEQQQKELEALAVREALAADMAVQQERDRQEKERQWKYARENVETLRRQVQDKEKEKLREKEEEARCMREQIEQDRITEERKQQRIRKQEEKAAFNRKAFDMAFQALEKEKKLREKKELSETRRMEEERAKEEERKVLKQKQIIEEIKQHRKLQEKEKTAREIARIAAERTYASEVRDRVQSMTEQERQHKYKKSQYARSVVTKLHDQMKEKEDQIRKEYEEEDKYIKERERRDKEVEDHAAAMLESTRRELEAKGLATKALGVTMKRVQQERTKVTIV